MITATLLGRIQTKLLTFLIVGLVTLAFVWRGGEAYFLVFAIAIIAGLLLETLWGFLVSYQPGWYAFVFGVIEFSVIAGMATVIGVPMTLGAAMSYYLIGWVIVQLFLVYVLPVFRMGWVEYGGELW